MLKDNKVLWIVSLSSMYSVGCDKLVTSKSINYYQDDKNIVKMNMLEYFLTRLINIYDKI